MTAGGDPPTDAYGAVDVRRREEGEGKEDSGEERDEEGDDEQDEDGADDGYGGDERPAGSLRIACLVPSATDLCAALGLADRIVGVTHECDLPRALESAPFGAAAAPVLARARVLTRDRLAPAGLSQREIHSAVRQSARKQEKQVQQKDDDEDGAANLSPQTAARPGRGGGAAAAASTTADAVDAHQEVGDAGVPSLYPIDAAALRDAAPTLILTQDLCDACAPSSSTVARALSRIGRGTAGGSAAGGDDDDDDAAAAATVSVVSLSPHSLRDVLQGNVERVARACGVPRRGARLRRVLRRRLRQVGEAVERRLAVDRLPGGAECDGESPAGPAVMLLEWLDPPFDGGHWIPDMIRAAGARGCATAAEGRREDGEEGRRKSREISWNDVENADPDVLVVACCGLDAARNETDALRERRRWEGLRAASAARRGDGTGPGGGEGGGVWAVDGDRYFARPGPLLVRGVALLALCAHSARHPDLLQDLLELDWVDREWIEAGCRRIDSAGPAAPTAAGTEPAAEADVEDCVAIHDRACAGRETFYTDPSSGYRVFTEYAHRQRGQCCGSGCRHCPYGHENVRDDDKKPTKIQQPAVLVEGDRSLRLPLHPSEHDRSKVLFWSGGKDSFLAVRALVRQAKDQQPAGRGFGLILLTTYDATSGIIAHQEMPVSAVVRQARHLGLMLVGVPMHRRSSEPYVGRIRRALDLIEGRLGIAVSSLVFGDLHLSHVVEWREDHLSKLGTYRLEFPLYLRSYDELLRDLDASEVPCVVTASSVDAVRAGERYDAALRGRLAGASAIGGEPCDAFGENGEFHTLSQVWAVDRDLALGLIAS